MFPPPDQRGLTLLELVVAITIIGLALTGVMLTLNESIRHSAAPIVRREALALAQGTMEELMAAGYASLANQSCTPYDGMENYCAEVVINENSLEGENGKWITVTVLNPALVSGLTLTTFRTTQ